MLPIAVHLLGTTLIQLAILASNAMNHGIKHILLFIKFKFSLNCDGPNDDNCTSCNAGEFLVTSKCYTPSGYTECIDYCIECSSETTC